MASRLPCVEAWAKPVGSARRSRTVCLLRVYSVAWRHNTSSLLLHTRCRRCAGKNGKTKFTIENATRTRIVLADTKIHILG